MYSRRFSNSGSEMVTPNKVYFRRLGAAATTLCLRGAKIRRLRGAIIIITPFKWFKNNYLFFKCNLGKPCLTLQALSLKKWLSR